MLKHDTGWQHWDIPVGDSVDATGTLRLRLITDAYSRAIDRNEPTWKWGYWAQPRVVEVAADGRRQLRCDLIEQLDRSKVSVRLDDTGTCRALDDRGKDSTGATFELLGPGNGAPEPVRPAIAAFAPHRNGKSGVTIAEFELCVTPSPPPTSQKPASPPAKRFADPRPPFTRVNVPAASARVLTDGGWVVRHSDSRPFPLDRHDGGKRTQFNSPGEQSRCPTSCGPFQTLIHRPSPHASP
jgi:hypothetical protein